MSSIKSYIRRNVDIMKPDVCDRIVQTDNVFYITEVEQTMLYFIRIFNINIANLSTLCYGVVYNYSPRRYSVDTEPIETDSEDDEPQTMKTVDDKTVNKLIEESQKNKELIYNVIYKTDKNIFQSVKDRQKQISSTTSIGEVKKSESIGINTDISASCMDIVEVKRKVPRLTKDLPNESITEELLRSTQPVNQRNKILNKWAKDNRPTLHAHRRQHHSPLRLLDVQVIQPQVNRQEILNNEGSGLSEQGQEQHQHRILQNPPPAVVSPVKPIATTLPYPPQQNNQREHQTTCENLQPSHMQIVDQSQSMHNTSPNVDHSNSSYLYQRQQQTARKLSFHVPNRNSSIRNLTEHSQPTGYTSNYQLLDDETSTLVTLVTQTNQHFDYVMPSTNQQTAPLVPLRDLHEEDPIPLVKKVTQSSDIFFPRPKSVCNPRPGHEYMSPYAHAYYPPVTLDRLPFLRGNNMPLVHSTSQPFAESQISQLRAAAENHINQLQQQHQKQQFQKQQHLQRQQQQQEEFQQQQQFQHQEMLQQLNQQQLNSGFSQHVNVLQNQGLRLQRAQLLPSPPPPPLPQVVPIPLDTPTQTETLQIPASNGPPINYTSSSNSFSYTNNMGNVQVIL